MNALVEALGTAEGPSEEEWVALRLALSANWAVPDTKTVDGLEVVKLTLAKDKPIDLSAVPASKAVNLHIQMRQEHA